MRLLFIALSILLGVGLLGAVEIGFRLAGYGGVPPTFDRVGVLPDGSELVFTTFAGPASYFRTSRSPAGSLERDAFVMPKPPGTFRVMVVGASAAKGIPLPRSLAWTAFLREMLGDLLPSHRVEVINLGVTAIASYGVLGICTEALDYDPDLVVIWCGNNEFFGALGVASMHSAGRSPTMIRLTRAARSLGVVQWAEDLVSDANTGGAQTLMEAMIGRDFIAPGDRSRSDAARNLRVFVGDMLDRCARRGVPALVCIPPANERDLGPIGTPDVSHLAEADRAAHEEALRDSRATERTDPIGAEASARRAMLLAPEDARAHFALGRALHTQGRHAEAVVAFERAIDLDPMPWRPPMASLEALRSAAAARNAAVCDLRAAFRAASPGGSIGWELMADHVHPNLAGQELAARAVAGAIPSMPFARAFGMSSPEGLAPGPVYLARLGANPFDDYAVDSSMRALASVAMFRESNPQFLARFDAACAQFEAGLPEPVHRAVRAWADAPTVGGERRPINGLVALALVNMGRVADAAPHYRAARDAVEPYGTWELEYAYLALACDPLVDEGELRDADRFIERGRFLVEHSDSTSGAAERYLGGLLQVVGRHEEAIPMLLTAKDRLGDRGRLSVDMALVDSLLALGRREEARAILERGASAGIEAYRARLAREFGE